MDGRVNKTDVVMFYCLPEDMFFDEFASFMKHEQKYYIDNTNMFN